MHVTLSTYHAVKLEAKSQNMERDDHPNKGNSCTTRENSRVKDEHCRSCHLTNKNSF